MTRYHAAAVIGRKYGGELRGAGEIYRLCPNLLEVGGEFEYYRGLSCLLNALDAGEAAVLIGVDAYAENVAVRRDREAVEAAVMSPLPLSLKTNARVLSFERPERSRS